MAEKAEIVITAKDQTGGAFQSATKGIQAAGQEVTAFGAKLAGLGILVTAAVATFNHFDPRPIIDQGDALNKLTQRTGIAVETLSSYQYAAKLADVSNEDLNNGLKKLSLNIAAAARGEQEQAAAFRAIGVSVTDASGKVRDTDKVFEDLAEKFSGYNDGAKKNAIANATVGKGFDTLIPLLNAGKQGFTDAREELEKFGGVLTGDFAKKAEQFNDNLTKLEVSSQKLRISLAGGLIDRLVEFSDKLVDAAKNTSLLQFAVSALGDFFSGNLTKDFVFGKALPPDKLKEAQQEVARLTPIVAALKAELAAGDEDGQIGKRLDELQAKLAKAKGAIDAEESRVAKIGGGRGVVNPVAVRAPKGDAPDLPNKDAQSNADALLKKQLDGRIKAIQETLERESDLFKFADTKLQEQYDHSELSIQQFYDRKNQIQLDALAEQQKAFDAEIAALRDYQAKATKPQDRQDAENKINEVIAKQAKVYREAGQAAEVAEQQRVRATEEFGKSLRELDAQLQELAGNSLGAALTRNAQQFDETQKLLNKGGTDNTRAQQIKALVDLQANLNEQQRQYGLLTADAQLKEESFLLIAQKSGLSREEVEKQVGAIRQTTLKQLDDIIAKTEALGPKTEEQIQQLEQLKLARQRAAAEADPGLTRFQEQARGVADTISSSIEDAIIEGGDKGFRGLGTALLRAVINDQFTKPLSEALTGAIRSVGDSGEGGGFARLASGAVKSIGGFFGAGSDTASAGGTQSQVRAVDNALDLAGAAASTTAQAAASTAAATALAALTTAATTAAGALSAVGGSSAASSLGGFGSGAGYGFEDLAAFFHSGGIVGGGSNMRRVGPLAFAGHVPRYHNGGISGLAPDERPAILRDGEEVLRADDPRHRRNGGGSGGGAMPQVTNNFTVGDNVSRATQDQIAQRAYEGARRAWGRNA